jgi:predicted Zn finger-like uncharacterized protein
MTATVACPNCQNRLRVEEAVLGREVKCPACATVFTAEAAALPAEDEVQPAPPRPARTAPRPPADEDDRPRRPAARRGRDDEEDDRPARSATRRPRRVDEDDEPRGRSAKKQGSGAGTVLAILAGVGLLLCGGCGAAAYWTWLKINEGAQAVRGAMTSWEAELATAQQAREKAATARQEPGGKAGPAPAPRGDEKSKPPEEQPLYASEQQFADAMFDNEQQAFGNYVRQPLQLTGTVRQVATSPDGLVNEIFFEPQVEDLKTHQKKPFKINCRIPKPVPRSSAAVGARVTVRGRLTGGSKESATLNESVVVGAVAPPPQPERPNKPDKPGDQPMVVKAEDLARELNEGKQTAYARYARQPLQVEGVVHQQTGGAGGSIAEVAFRAEVKDDKTGTMKPFLIQCKFGPPLPAGDKVAELAAGKTITIRGKLTSASYVDRRATLDNCVLVESGKSP